MPIPPRDVAQARRLLTEATQPNPAMSLMIPNTPELLQAGQVIQAMAQEAGFQVTIQATESASLIQLATKGEYQTRFGNWSGRTDPDGNIYNFAVCNAPLNDSHYCNPEVDRELDAARTVEAPAQRLDHYRKAAEQLLRDLPMIYLWHNKWLWASTIKLTGLSIYPDGLIRPQGLRLQ